MMTRQMIARAGVMSALVFAACEGAGFSTEPVDPTTCSSVQQVVINPDNVTIRALGATAQLTASAYDQSGAAVTGVKMSWTSLNAAVATVTTTGVVTARAAGTALLVASASSCAVSDTLAANIQQVVDAVTVNPASVSISAGASTNLQAVVIDSLGNPVQGATVSWTSSNPAVASVDGTGQVTGVSDGSTTIVASNSGLADSAAVAVTGSTTTPPPSSGQHNEPAGMTRLLSTDGSSKQYSSTVGSPFYGGRWLDDQYVEVVSDPGNPSGSGFAIEKRYIAGDGDGWKGVASLDGYGNGYGALSEEYFRIRAKFSSNWDHHATGTQKMWYFGTTNRGTATDFFVSAHSVGSQFQIRFTPQITDASPGQDAMGLHGSQGDYLASSNASHRVNPGDWFTLEVWVKAQSAPGAADGEARMWLNGSALGHWQGRQWLSSNASGSKLNGIQTFLFWGGNGDTKLVNDYIRLGELYVSGKK